MKMEETEKLRTISEIAALLRETTVKKLANIYDGDGTLLDPQIVYDNALFDDEEHELVKRKFLHLLNSL